MASIQSLRRRLPHGALMGAVLAALVSTGCGDPSPATSYFPLEKGHRWTYRVTSEWDNGSIEREQITLDALGQESLEVAAPPKAGASASEGVVSSGKAWRRRSDSGVDYWLRSDASGIYRVASKFDLDEVAKADAAPRYVLKTPLVAGTTWQATTTAYLLRRRSEFPPEIRHSHPSLPMSYTLEAVGQSVTTPAGTFKDCVRVKGQATVKLFSDGVQGWKDLALDTREWYCAGVGLVQLERDEPANSTFLVGGHLKMELMTWQ